MPPNEATTAASAEDFEVVIDGSVVSTFKPIRHLLPGVHHVQLHRRGRHPHHQAFVGLDTAGGDNTALIDAVSVSRCWCRHALRQPRPRIGQSPASRPARSAPAMTIDPNGSGWTFTGVGGNGSGVDGNHSTLTSGNPVAPEGVQVGFTSSRTGSFSQSDRQLGRGHLQPSPLMPPNEATTAGQRRGLRDPDRRQRSSPPSSPTAPPTRPIPPPASPSPRPVCIRSTFLGLDTAGRRQHGVDRRGFRRRRRFGNPVRQPHPPSPIAGFEAVSARTGYDHRPTPDRPGPSPAWAATARASIRQPLDPDLGQPRTLPRACRSDLPPAEPARSASRSPTGPRAPTPSPLMPPSAAIMARQQSKTSRCSSTATVVGTFKPTGTILSGVHDDPLHRSRPPVCTPSPSSV